jgi:predicted RNase H-like nuclease (RuvC/YqgF family)
MSGENYDDGFWKGVESRDDEVETLQAELAAAKAQVEALREALNTMLDYYGEDEHNKATHDAARTALKETK